MSQMCVQTRSLHSLNKQLPRILVCLLSPLPRGLYLRSSPCQKHSSFYIMPAKPLPTFIVQSKRCSLIGAFPAAPGPELGGICSAVNVCLPNPLQDHEARKLVPSCALSHVPLLLSIFSVSKRMHGHTGAWRHSNPGNSMSLI